MNAEQLAEWLKSDLPGHEFGRTLNSRSLQVKHVLNWGGFVNHSFTVSDGTTRYHLKLTNDREHVRRLATWRGLHRILDSRYRTPELIDWVDFPEIGFSGLVLQHVEATTADFCRNPKVVASLIETAHCLHHDEEISSYLRVSTPPKTRFEHFVETYIERFTIDLAAVAADPPPFVSSTLFRWMQDQTQELREVANRIPAFHAPAVEPVHGDLNEGNVLVAVKDWFIVDWDDLALGDPAVEFAIVVWPLVYRAGKRWQDFLAAATGGGFAERIEICLRAQLLDEVIDTLADYVQAHVVPSEQSRVQQIKGAQHEEALRRYNASIK
jgi:thiamine kinase-like enzyme